MLTSRYTLDSAPMSARREMAAQADLIGAIRLPSRAFWRVAGTEVVTDLLMLRRRDPDQPAPDEHPIWMDTTPAELSDPDTGAGETITVNTYYRHTPKTSRAHRNSDTACHGSPTLFIAGDTGRQLAEQLRQRLTAMIDAALRAAGPDRHRRGPHRRLRSRHSTPA